MSTSLSPPASLSLSPLGRRSSPTVPCAPTKHKERVLSAVKRPYNSRNPQAGVVNYELTRDGILLEFTDGKHRYLYNHDAPGPDHVKAMKRLAAAGQGLTTYVNQHVRDHYARKLPL